MPPIRFSIFDKGLWVSGSSDTIPPGALRRARGVHSIPTRSIRSRWGSVVLFSLDGHSLFRFGDLRFVGAGTQFYRNGVSIKSGLDGNRLAFVRMPPASGVVKDSLFVAGGGDLFKVDSAGAVTQWGINAPGLNPSLAAGAAGALNGTYKYRVTFKNTVTGTRSNPSPDDIEITVANLQVNLSNIPISSDAQVNAREIFRTAAGGAILFKVDQINDNTTTVFTDNVADGDLQPIELLFDNTVPTDDYDDAAGPHAGRAWWTRSSKAGEEGRVFYSPAGRAEAVEGFIEPGTSDDPVQKIVPWAGFMWAFTEAGVFQIIGESEPFVFRELSGAPGTSSPFTVRATPAGIIYQSNDGIRLANLSGSRPLVMDAVVVLFQGEAAENLTAFEGVVAGFSENEYFISDGVATIAVNIDTGTWRDLGIGSRAFFFEEDTGDMLASFTSGTPKILRFEVENQLTDDGQAIPFEVQTKTEAVDQSLEGVVQRLYIDANTGGETVVPVVILDEVETTLSSFSSSIRTVIEIPVGKKARRVAIRLTSDTFKQIEVFEIGADVHVGALAGVAL